MNKTAHFVSLLSESATLAMSRKSRELIQKGVPIINLSLGEPDFNTPEFIKTAAKEAMEQNYTHYMAVNGYQDLREVISEKFKRDNNLTYTPDQIVVSTGAKQTLANLMLSLINPGDEVILPAPYWVTYYQQIKMVQGHPKILKTTIDTEFKIQPQQLDDVLNEKTKLILLNSPSNPTGTVYSKSELEQLADVVKKYPQVLILSDEIYEHIIFEGKKYSIGSDPELKNRVITVNGVSKAFAMTGWRIGYMGGPQWVADACTKIQGQFTSGANSIAQRATLAALKADPSIISPMIKTFNKRRDLVYQYIRSIPGLKTIKPQGAFYIYPDFSAYFGTSYNNYTIKNASILCQFLLEKGNVATVPGTAFGTGNHIRISFAEDEVYLTQAMEQIKNALNLLK